MKKKILALVLARKKSTRLKNKNILKIKGKPLIEWTFDIFKKENIRKLFANVLVSTDSIEIINISKKYKFLIPLIRPKSLSNKFTTSEAAALHAIEWYEKNFQKIDGVFLFQPTSPYRTQKNIISAVKIFRKKNQQIVSVCSKSTYKFKKNDINGSLYLTPISLLKKFNNFTGSNYVKIKMYKESENIDIDTIEDLTTAREIKKI
jgi:CMP-N-acetylneuraminic acid synthetase